MEGVGARFGRSSTRYGATPVFTGPVRKWKKKWVHAPPPATTIQTAPSTAPSSHILFYKWTPITPSQNKDGNYNGGNNSNGGNADSNISNEAGEEPPRRKFNYIPLIVLEEKANESSEQIEEEEAKPTESQPEANTVEETTSKSDGYDENPDMNDEPVDESQAQAPENDPVERHDVNEGTLDLSLGLTAHKEENESDSEADQVKDDQIQ